MKEERVIIYTPSSIQKEKYSTRSKFVSSDMPNKCYATIEEAVNEQVRREKEISNNRAKAEPLAETKLDEIEDSIFNILKSNDGDIYFHYEGDSHGVYDEKIIISVHVDGFRFKRDLDTN